jgi:hypothetical protein
MDRILRGNPAPFYFTTVDLTEHPRVDEAVVLVDQDSLTSGILASAGDSDDILQKYPSIFRAPDRARGKYFDGVICHELWALPS